MPCHPSNGWTDAELSLLTRLAAEGFSAGMIAAELADRSRNAGHWQGTHRGENPYQDETVLRAASRRLWRPRKRIRVKPQAPTPPAAPVPPGSPLEMDCIGLDNPLPWPQDHGCRSLDGEATEMLWCNRQHCRRTGRAIARIIATCTKPRTASIRNIVYYQSNYRR